MRKRNIQMKFWCNEEELATIEKKIEASGKTKQDYLLSCALKKKITRIDGLEDISELIGQVKRIGNNINQIARIANETGQIDSEGISNSAKALALLYRQAVDIRKEVESWRL